MPLQASYAASPRCHSHQSIGWSCGVFSHIRDSTKVKACVQNNPSEEIDTNLAGGIRNLSSLTVGILFLGYPGIPAAYIKIRPIARARYMGVEMDETEGGGLDKMPPYTSCCPLLSCMPGIPVRLKPFSISATARTTLFWGPCCFSGGTTDGILPIRAAAMIPVRIPRFPG
jgi:hypothetical protein